MKQDSRFFLLRCWGAKIILRNLRIKRAFVRGGVGNIIGDCQGEPIWTGEFHIWPIGKSARVSIHLTDVNSIHSRTTLNEDDEPWSEVVVREQQKFNYEYEAIFQQSIRDAIEKLKGVPPFLHD